MSSLFIPICIGASAGGFEAISKILLIANGNNKLSIMVVQHIQADADLTYLKYLNKKLSFQIKEAYDKEPVLPGFVYYAPPAHHLMVDDGPVFALSVGKPVNYCRPSIDVLFESAVEVFGNKLTGIVLTGANNDGAEGLKHIHDAGGKTIVQDPSTAYMPDMPSYALKKTQVDMIGSLDEIGLYLKNL